MKKLLRKILNKFGYDIIRFVHIEDPILYNTAIETDKFYENKELTDYYVKFQVGPIVQNNLKVLADKKIDLNGKTVLDVSCGTGHFLKAIKEKFPTAQIFGTENSPKAKNLTQELLQGITVEDLEIENNFLPFQYYMVCCMHVVEHLTDARKSLKNLMEMVQPGGILFLAVPDGRVDNFPGHVHFWGKTGWRLLLHEVFPEHKIETGHMDDKLALYGIIYKGS